MSRVPVEVPEPIFTVPVLLRNCSSAALRLKVPAASLSPMVVAAASGTILIPPFPVIAAPIPT